MKVYVTLVLKQGVNIKNGVSYSNLENRNPLGHNELSSKIMSVKLLVIVIIDVKRYPSAYCLMKGSCFICSDLKCEHYTIKLESQPLSSSRLQKKNSYVTVYIISRL